MNFMLSIVILLIFGYLPAYAENPRILVEPLRIVVRGEVKELTNTRGFKMKAQMFVRQKATSVLIDDEVFILQVRIRNYTTENLTVSKDGYLRDEDWRVDVPGLSVGVESDKCKIIRISSEDVEPCRGELRFDDIGPRMARDINLVLRFNGDVQSGDLDFKVGLNPPQSAGTEAEAVWTRPVRIYIDPWPVREFLKFWDEKESWRAQQKDMRDNGKSGMISRHYVSGGGLRIEENYEDGQLNGIRRTYFENGVVKDEEHFRADRLHGERFVYQRNKEMVLYEIYQSGERVSFARFSSFDQRREKKEKIARVRALVAKEYPQLRTELKVELVPHEEELLILPTSDPVPPGAE